jgi:hypothetical protein
MESVFDWKYYIESNEDLKNKILNEKDAWDHFIEYGIYENKMCKNYDKIFNPYFYINYHKDLINSNINNKDLAFKHWYNYGLYEMRIGKQTNDGLCEYSSISNIFDFILKYSYVNENDYKVKHITDNFYYVLSKNNNIDIDLKFYVFVNKINKYDKYEILEDLYNNGLDGKIYHPKQLINIFKNIKFYENKKEILISYDIYKYINASDFIKNNIYNKSFDQLSEMILKKVDTNILNNYENILILVFIGDIEIGNIIIEKLIEYKNIESFDVAFCFNENILYNKLKEKIKKEFNSYIYISKECGNDIIPTLLMYNNIIKKYKHIIKLQTKSCFELFFNLTDFLLNKNLNELLEYKRTDCNCIGYDKYYENANNDFFNQILYKRYIDIIDINKKFVAGTIFYADSIVFDSILNFIKNNNFRAFLLNNMYDSNRIIIAKSHIHFLERLFGIIEFNQDFQN